MMLSSVAWIGFGYSNSLSRTLVHFCPNALLGGSQQSSTVDCSLTVFGHTAEPEQIILEGARIGMPDGIAVEEAFPSIADFTGMFGVALTITSSGAKLDASQSECWIELVATNFSVAERTRNVGFMEGAHAHSMRYIPHMVYPTAKDLNKNSKIHRESFRDPGLAVLDSYNSTSVIVVNPHETTRFIQRSFDAASARDFKNLAVEAKYRSNSHDTLSIEGDESGEERPSSRLVGIDNGQDRMALPPYSISEHKLEKTYYVSEQPREGSWGISNINTVSVAENDEGCLYFAMYRDTITKRPMSVCSL
jgi:hypothetical protein